MEGPKSVFGIQTGIHPATKKIPVTDIVQQACRLMKEYMAVRMT